MSSNVTVESLLVQAAKYPSSMTKPQKCPFKELIDALSDNEEVKLAFIANICTLGKERYANVAVAFTSKRLLIAGTPDSLFGIFTKKASVYSVKLDTVNSVGSNSNRVHVNTIGDEDIIFSPYTPNVRNELAQAIQSFIDDYQATKATPVAQTVNNIIQKTPAQELKEFKELLDMGIISQEEFDAKKKQLLGL